MLACTKCGEYSMSFYQKLVLLVTAKPLKCIHCKTVLSINKLYAVVSLMISVIMCSWSFNAFMPRLIATTLVSAVFYWLTMVFTPFSKDKVSQ